MSENINPKDHPDQLNWQDRLKHLEADAPSAEEEPVEDFVAIHDAKPEEEGPKAPVLPEGVSFRKSRGGKDKSAPAEPIVGKLLSKIGVSKSKEDDPDTVSEQNGTSQNSTSSAQTQSKIQSTQDLKKQFSGLTTPLEELLSKVSTIVLVDEYRKKKRLVWISFAVVTIAAIGSYVLLFFGGGGELGYWTRRISLIAFFVCFGIASIELSLKLSKSQPKLARGVLGFFSILNADAKRNKATLEIDMGDYTAAEKTLLKAVGSINRTKNPRAYVTTYASLAVVRANVGKVLDAEKQSLQLLETAKKYYDARPNNVNGTMLATTLVSSARVCDWLDKHDDALKLYGSAIELLFKQKCPQADLLATTLASAGYQYNLAGKHEEAILLLNKADEINKNMPDARASTKALIKTNLGIAYMGLGKTEKASILINEAKNIAENPSALKELPAVYLAQATLHNTTGFKEAADQAYQKSIVALELQHPPDNLQLVRVLNDYAQFLKDFNRAKDAEKNTNRATQIKYQLDQTNYQSGPVVKDEVQQVQAPVLKSRFPIFWILIALFFTFDVYNEGLRLAGKFAWFWSVGAITVVVMKLLAKYGKHAEQEASQGAVLTILSKLPFVRNIVPELAVLPRQTTAIVIGCALAFMFLINLTKPAPDTVPESGLLSYEYTVLSRNLAIEGNLEKALLAADKASAPDISGDQSKTVAKIKKYFFPVNPQPDKALSENYRAVRNQTTNKKEAIQIWRSLIEKYPEFEIPYANLATTLSTDKKTLDEAEELATKALELNPNNNQVLMANYFTNLMSKKRKKANKYFRKAMTNLEDVGGAAAGVYGLMADGMDSLDDMEEDLEKKIEEKEATTSSSKENPAKESSDDEKNSEEKTIKKKSELKEEPAISDK